MSVTLRALWIIARRALWAAVKGFCWLPFLPWRCVKEQRRVDCIGWFISSLILCGASVIGTLLGIISAFPSGPKPPLPTWVLPLSAFILVQMVASWAWPHISEQTREAWTASIKKAEAEIAQKQASAPSTDTLLRPSQGEQAETLLRVVSGGTAFDRCDFRKGEL